MAMQQVGATGTKTDRFLSFLNLPNGNYFFKKIGKKTSKNGRMVN
jgi:hypothetical protein